jgi:branched-chain amino acid transport system substrate-binding protein
VGDFFLDKAYAYFVVISFTPLPWTAGAKFSQKEVCMMKGKKISRRTFIKTTGAGLAVSTLGFPAIVRGAKKMKEVKIACVYPLSGGAGAMGTNAARGWHIAIDEINAAGGIKSLGGAKIKGLLGDSQSTPRVGMAEIEKVAMDKDIPAVIGCWQSAVTFPSTQVSEQYGLPHLVAVSTQPKICRRGFKYVWRLGMSSEHQNAGAIDFVLDMDKASGKGAKRVATLALDDNYGRSCSNDFKKGITKKSNQEIVAELYYPPKTTNLDVEIAKLKAAKPDVLYLTGYLTDANLVMRALHTQRVNTFGNVTGGAGYVDPKFLEMVGPLANYLYSVASWDYEMSRDLEKEFNANIKKRYGVDANHHSALLYCAVYVVKDALERAGTTNRDAVREAMASTHITSGRAMTCPFKFIKFDERGENIGFDTLMAQVLDGKYRTIWPDEFRGKYKPVWPTPKWEKR